MGLGGGSSNELLRLHHERKTERKGCSQGEGSVFGTESDLKVNKKNTLSSIPGVLLRSTNQRIQPVLTRGQERSRLSSALIYAAGILIT